MKKIILILIVLTASISACKKEATFDPSVQATIDDGDIQTYLKANSIVAVKDPSGLYYQVINAGTGGTPNINSNISVNYSGKYLDGVTLDQGTLTRYPLKNLIQGWGIGIPYIKVGGRIVLYIPSALAYGHSPTNGVRADAVLIFTIDLTGI
ncbi:FKBP-type peptidyl-prolyl cis-trans isomerase [Mucilaginibacter sp. HMF5004]|uniref:FKBP-type peptidyl-prolyl cis-trans isomerase n=1 Tax=Mucilaginibacter rivuli TaxID=2857527 RepID=UPI001C5D7D69|nr:FKBP-type peptidyl-prolyl cis-trans isomerase [Mucilaginibacter rivuli]MBW4890236.1 FKBP-type peptidyl-prolyl cis-trans isomerase [Mucilaginibacter rivuli]